MTNDNFAHQPYQAYPAFPAGSPAWQQCRRCGSVPAAQVTYRAHRGMIILMQFRRIDGPFCRDCGLDAFRTMTADTMLQGWWGALSFCITPVILLLNLALRHKVAALAPPGPAPAPYYSQPSPGPGKPLFARPTAIAAMAVLAAILLLMVLPAITAT